MTPAIEAAIGSAVDAARMHVPIDAVLIGIGWLTVELDRAARELGVQLVAAPPDVALGATCRFASPSEGVALVLMEPATDGRAAGALARLDEGPWVTWWDVGVADAGVASSGLEASAGPFGAVRLVRPEARDGPFAFLRARPPATISA